MAPKKNKGQKINLSDFLADSATGSWADEMEDMPLAPAAKDPNAPKRGDAYFDNVPDRAARGDFDSSRPPRDELPLPTRPPYTAFVGNLDFETTEDDLKGFFEGLSTVSAKIIRDHEQKPKGFGYVEFTTLDGLKDALSRSGTQLLGRTVRTSVAEPPKESSRGGFGGGPSMAEEASQWRRSGPLPTRSPPPSSRRLPSSNFGSSDAAGAPVDRDWGAARGSKFAPAQSGPSEGARGGFGSGFRAERDGGAGGFRERGPERDAPAADLPSDWRGARAARPPPPPAPERPQYENRHAKAGPGFIEREVGLTGAAESEETWSRGTKFQPRPEQPARPPRDSATPEAFENNDWRSNRKPSLRQGSHESSPAASAHPSPQPARRALNLLPRSGASSTSASEAGGAAPATPSKASPFGSAKPIDTATKEREAAQKLAKIEAQRKADAEAKAKANAAEREKNAAAAAAKPAQADRPQARHPSRGGTGPAGSGPRQPIKRNPSSNGPQSPEPLGEPVATVDADGFVVPAASNTATRKAQLAAEQAAKEKQERDRQAEVKPSFSFAKAALASGLIEGEGEGEDEDVEEVTKEVEQTKI